MPIRVSMWRQRLMMEIDDALGQLIIDLAFEHLELWAQRPKWHQIKPLIWKPSDPPPSRERERVSPASRLAP